MCLNSACVNMSMECWGNKFVFTFTLKHTCFSPLWVLSACTTYFIIKDRIVLSQFLYCPFLLQETKRNLPPGEGASVNPIETTSPAMSEHLKSCIAKVISEECSKLCSQRIHSTFRDSSKSALEVLLICKCFKCIKNWLLLSVTCTNDVVCITKKAEVASKKEAGTGRGL